MFINLLLMKLSPLVVSGQCSVDFTSRCVLFFFVSLDTNQVWRLMDSYIYIIFPIIIAIPIDIFLTRNFLNRSNNAMAVFAPIPLYLSIAFLWSIYVTRTVVAFQGQGVLGLYLIVGLGMLCSLLRLILGLIMLIYTKYR